MSIESHKDLARRGIMLWAAAAEDADSLFAPGYQNHQAPSVEGGTQTLDLAGWQSLVEGHRANFSHGKIEILLQVGEGDLVVTRWRFTFTQTADFMGCPPRGGEITWGGVQVDRFEGDKIAESWVDWDMYSFFKGVGLLKE